MTLIALSYSNDNLLQHVPKESSREVYSNVKSISFHEWNETGKRGMKPQWKMEVFAEDYQGEMLAEYQSVRYSIYRTYQPREDLIELYLEERSSDGG